MSQDVFLSFLLWHHTPALSPKAWTHNITKIQVFLDMALCWLVNSYWSFRQACCLHCQGPRNDSLLYYKGPKVGGSKLFWNNGNYLLIEMVSYLRRPERSSPVWESLISYMIIPLKCNRNWIHVPPCKVLVLRLSTVSIHSGRPITSLTSSMNWALQ